MPCSTASMAVEYAFISARRFIGIDINVGRSVSVRGPMVRGDGLVFGVWSTRTILLVTRLGRTRFHSCVINRHSCGNLLLEGINLRLESFYCLRFCRLGGRVSFLGESDTDLTNFGTIGL